MGEEREEEKRIFGVGSPSRSGSPRNPACDNCPCTRGQGLLAGMSTTHLGTGLQDVTLAHGPHPKQPFCHGSNRDPGLEHASSPSGSPKPSQGTCAWRREISSGIWGEKSPFWFLQVHGYHRFIARRIEGGHLALRRPAPPTTIGECPTWPQARSPGGGWGTVKNGALSHRP